MFPPPQNNPNPDLHSQDNSPGSNSGSNNSRDSRVVSNNPGDAPDLPLSANGDKTPTEKARREPNSKLKKPEKKL